MSENQDDDQGYTLDMAMPAAEWARVEEAAAALGITPEEFVVMATVEAARLRLGLGRQ